jgi:glucosyl-3-phosphoglycerate synthase
VSAPRAVVKENGPAVGPTFDHRDFDVAALVDAKAGRRISLCLPARDEEPTVGPIVERVRQRLVERHPLVDEILVVDDASSDATARTAADAGARVVVGEGRGKGEALWTAVANAAGDLLVFCDADVRDFDPRFVVGLVGPLLQHDGLAFVKAFYERPTDGGPRGGGRVTELMARPLIAALFPELSAIVQPLAGEFAAPRAVLESVPFVEGYGVDLGLLVDVSRAYGVDAIAQVDLGVRVHRNRPLDDLGPMATVVLLTALQRAGIDAPGAVELEAPGAAPVTVRFGERPARR